MKVHGQCHCGAIQYEADVNPAAAAICHCVDCQILTGSAFRVNVQAPADTFHMLRGSPVKYIKTAESGAKRCHAFCGACGGPVYSSALENPKTYSLRVGALDERASIEKPASQQWVKRRMPWLCDIGDIPGHPQQS